MTKSHPLKQLREAVLDLTPEGQPRDGRAERVPASLLDLARAQYGLVSIRQCLACGVSHGRVARHVKAGRWVAIDAFTFLILNDQVAPGDWPAIAAQRGMIAALRTGDGIAPSGFAALALAGVQGAPLHFVPEVACRSPRRLRSTATLRVRRIRAAPDSPRYPRLLSLPTGPIVTAPIYAIAQVAAECDRDTLVSILDSAIERKAITWRDLDIIDGLLAGRRGSLLFRSVRPLVDGRAESPLETRGRLQCIDHGVPPHDLQRVVRDRFGAFVARCDMVWELGGGRLLIIELDGEHHRRTGQIDRDNSRDNDLTTLGHRVFHLAWHHLGTGAIWRLVMKILAEEGCLAA